MWVFDATPLIYLAKANQIDLLEYLDERSVTPEEIHEEVVERGLDEGYPDARRIEQSIDEGFLEVVETPETSLVRRLARNSNLSDADIAVLAYADAHDGTAVMDEAYGRSVADTEKIETRGTAYLVLQLAADGSISPEMARQTIDRMVDEGWYCSPSLYAKIIRKIDNM